jgi:hypothetical protein
LAGAIIGGIAGHQNQETPEGIAIGGVAGAIAGGLLGKSHDNQAMRQYEYQQAQQRQQAYQMSRAVSLDDAVAMSRSGMSPKLIITQVRANGIQQEIGVKEVILLHENGVPESVIQEMQRSRIGSGTPAVVVNPAPVYVPRQPQIVIERYPVFSAPPVYYPPPHAAQLHFDFGHHGHRGYHGHH